MNFIVNDVTELEKWYDAKYPYTLVQEDAITTKELEEKVRKLEERLRRLRAKSSSGAGAPPPSKCPFPELILYLS